MNEVYLDLFKENFLIPILFSMEENFTLPLMLEYDYNPVLVGAIALTASILGLLVNYGIGRGIIMIISREALFELKCKEHFNKYSKIFNKFYSLIMLLVFFPWVEGGLVLMAGLFRLRFVPCLLMIVVIKAFYFYYMIVTA